MKDFLGRDLAIGDLVVIQDRNYKTLKIAQIRKFGIKVSMWPYSVEQRKAIEYTPINRDARRLIKIEESDIKI